MSKITMFLDTDSLDFNPDANKTLFEGVDETTTVVELFSYLDALYDRYTAGIDLPTEGLNQDKGHEEAQGDE